MLRRSLLAILGILTWSTGMAHACSCSFLSSGHGCNKSWISDGVVFAGTVTSKTLVEESPDSGGGARVGSRYAVRFSTVEMFHGNPANDQELVVYTGLGGGDCGYPFAVGVRYLVDASTRNGRLGTGICSFTSPEVTASGVIKELRSLRDTGRADDLFGLISEAPRGVRYEDTPNTLPLAGVSIRLMSSRGEVFSAITDTHGVYSFPTLPAGAYRLEHDLPVGLARNSKEPISVEVSDQDGRGAGCRVDVAALPDGVIAGTVVDGDGKGLAGFVTLEPIDPAEAKLSSQRGGLPGYDTPDGNFTLSWLPPGRYRLIFRPKGSDFRHAFYWPAPSDGAGSEAIEVALGQHVENIHFEVGLPSGKN